MTPEVACPVRIRPATDGWFEVIFPLDAPLWHFHNLAKWFEDAAPWPDKPNNVVTLSDGEGDWSYFLVPPAERKWDRYLTGATAACRAFQYDCATGKLLDDPRLSMLTTPGLAMMSRNVPYLLQKPRDEDPPGTIVVDLKVSANPPPITWVMPQGSDLTDTFPRTERDRADDDTDATWISRLVASIFASGPKK